MKSKNTKKILSKKRPEKGLLRPLKKTGGRTSSGKITVRHRGGGAKRLYRIIEFGQEKLDIPAKVRALEYDPNRTCFIALIEYQDGEKKYILAPQGLKIGDQIVFTEVGSLSTGNRMKLKNIPIGTSVYNIELVPGRGGKVARTAGSFAQVMAQEGKYTHLKMPSGEIRKFFADGFASIGQVSNPEHRFQKLGKAGRARWKGKRPTVRGTAMIPPSHPHGGGEGKEPIGLKHPKTAWGKPALGVRTRKKKWTDKLIIQRRKKKR
ncbi:MAG: 50S ribosomal protein L2 [Patescibacteria group bacterium]|nr:50S ribosomal protein L2 [Patescibacteria group bacterium]